MSKTSKSARDNRANQLNPTHLAYHRSRGARPDDARRMAELSTLALNTRAKSPEQFTSSNLSAATPE